MSGGADSSGPVDVDADVLVVAHRRGRGVQPHAHAHWIAVRPRLRRERTLPRNGRSDGQISPGEDDEERIALVAGLVALMFSERVSQQPMMSLEDLRPADLSFDLRELDADLQRAGGHRSGQAAGVGRRAAAMARR